VENLRTDAAAVRTKISQLDAEHEQVSLRIAGLADELERLRDEATAAERRADQQRQSTALAQERLRSIAERRQQLVTLQEQGRKRIAKLQQRLEAVGRQREELNKRAMAVKEEAQRRRQELAALQERQRDIEQQLQAAEQRHGELVRRVDALQNEATALAGLEDELAERQQRLRSQAESLQQRRQQLERELAAVRQQAQQTETELAAAVQRLEQMRSRQRQAARLLREHRQKRSILDSAVAAGEERCTMLQELLRAHEGYAEGPKAVLEAARKGQLRGIVGAVADFLDVPARLEVAIEAGLGEELQWILVDDNQAAQSAIEYLRENKLGRATFMAVGAITAIPTGTPATVASRREGVIGVASRLVKFPRKFARIFEHLLGDLIVVKDLPTALRVRAVLHPQARVVTLRGEVVGHQGQISGGTVNGGVARSLGRRRQLEEIQQVVDELRNHLARMWEVEERLEQSGHEAAASVAEAEQAVMQLQSRDTQLRGNLAHLGDQARTVQVAAQELMRDLEELGEKLQATRERRAEAQREQKGLQHEAEQLEQQLETLRAQAVPDEALEAARVAVTETQVQAAEQAEKLRSAETLQAQYQSEQQRVSEDLANIAEELSSLQETERQVRASMSVDGDQVEALERQAQALREQVAQRTAELSQLRETAARLEALRRELDKTAQEQSERIHRLELSLAREESQLEFIAQQLSDQYDLTVEQALQQLPADFKEMHNRRQANALREQIRKLGPVNLSAIDEVERLRAREEFLQGQVADLQAARDDLLTVIEEIDNAANKAFMEAFKQVEAAFEELFVRLFDGGTTKLVLTNPDAPLEGGVDVMVQLPGKRQQNLLLLSGGERALTALALLFAMIKVKPSPFCVMDEIDAALDANNTERFTRMLKDFAKRSQFIVITHNPQTMVAADAHWGVTMEEPGVSMILPLELEEAQAQAEEISREQQRGGGTGGVPIGVTRVLPTRD